MHHTPPRWRYFVTIMGLLLLGLACTWTAGAATLTWDRNAETDMKDYAVYACFTPSCVVLKSATTLQPGFVAQPLSGVTPTYTIDLAGKEGFVAVSARDTTLNESVLSVPVGFDQRAPSRPLNPRLQ